MERLTSWLRLGGDPDFADAQGWTPLLAAAARGRVAVVDLLLRHDIPGARRADPKIKFAGADALPIFMAGQSADIATVRSLLRECPADLFEVATVNGHTVLLQAAFYGQKRHQRLAQHLLDNVGEILGLATDDAAGLAAARLRLMTATNVRAQNPLQLAQAYDIRPMVALLRGFDTSSPDGRADYARRLLARIAPPPPRSPQEARIQAATERLIGVVQDWLDRAQRGGVSREAALADVDETLRATELQINRLGSPLQRTPLIIACTGADESPLASELRLAFVDRLLARGADPLIHEVHAMGVNAVVRAAVWGHLSILELFSQRLSASALTDALNEKPLVNGFTALHDSVLRGLSARGEALERYVRQIEWLMRHGADRQIEDHAGWTQTAIAQAAADDPDFRDAAVKVLRALTGGGAA